MSQEIETVADVPDEYSLVVGAYERDQILEHANVDPDDYSHGQLFVTTDEGEYDNILFFPGQTPYLDKDVTRIV